MKSREATKQTLVFESHALSVTSCTCAFLFTDERKSEPAYIGCVATARILSLLALLKCLQVLICDFMALFI